MTGTSGKDPNSRSSIYLQITVVQDGIKRGLVTIKEDKSGDVLFATRSHSYTETINEGEFGEAPAHELVKNEKFNVHMSKRSQYANSIKHYVETKEGWKDDYVQYTAAIKRDNSLALVYSRRCPSMTKENSDIIEGDAEELLLCTYQPIFFTLFFSIFIGPKDFEFEILKDVEDFRLKRIETREFSIFIVWSLLSAMAPPAGTIIGMQSPPEGKDEKGERIETRTPGLNTTEAINMFRLMRLELWQIMIRMIEADRNHPLGIETGLMSTSLAKFYKYGRDEFDLHYVSDDRKYGPTKENSPLKLIEYLRLQPD